MSGMIKRKRAISEAYINELIRTIEANPHHSQDLKIGAIKAIRDAAAQVNKNHVNVDFNTFIKLDNPEYFNP